MQYSILVALFAGFLGFIELIRYLQKRQISRIEGMRREILELQLKSVKNQLDPHFTFNALNVLSALTLVGDQAGVNHFIDHFARLLRAHLNTSDQALVRLRDELEFVGSYFELQRLRFENQVVLDQIIHEDVNLHQKVPKMIIQTHVENALKHGLRSRLSNSRAKERGGSGPAGKIWIEAVTAGADTIIFIEDNGVGRGNSQISPEEKTGKGLSSLDRIFLAVRQLYKIEIKQEFEDLTDAAGNPSGTRVKVLIHNI